MLYLVTISSEMRAIVRTRICWKSSVRPWAEHFRKSARSVSNTNWSGTIIIASCPSDTVWNILL